MTKSLLPGLLLGLAGAGVVILLIWAYLVVFLQFDFFEFFLLMGS